MDLANLNNREKQKLSDFERELGVVLVAYQPDENSGNQPSNVQNHQKGPSEQN